MIHVIVLIVGLIAVVPMLLYTALISLWLVSFAAALITEPIRALILWHKRTRR